MELTKETLIDLFEYRDGALYWRNPSSYRVKVGDRVGCLNGNGYFHTSIGAKWYLVHRLIYMMFHGTCPQIVDHIDGDRSNNCIKNLRGCTLSQNLHNSKRAKNNTSGVKGVNWAKQSNKWEVRLRINGRRLHFGYFQDLEFAELVATEARVKHHGEFARHE